MAIKHKFVSQKPDLADSSLINPSDWNETHEIDPGTVGTTELAPGAVTAEKLDSSLGLDETRTIVELKQLFRTTVATRYAELSYNGSGDLTQVDVWVDNTKSTKLFTRVLTYTGTDLTGVSTTNETTGTVLVAALTYTVDGDLETIQETVT